MHMLINFNCRAVMKLAGKNTTDHSNFSETPHIEEIQDKNVGK